MEKILLHIKQLLEEEEITASNLEKKIGASKGVLLKAFKNGTDIQAKWILKIVVNYPNFLKLIHNSEKRDQISHLSEPKAEYGNKNMIKDRVVQYLDSKGISKYKFYQLTGLSNGSLDKTGSIGADKCELICNHFEDLDANWLLTGKGKMLFVKNIVSEPPSEYGNKHLIPVYDIVATAGSNHGAVSDHPVEYIDPGDLFRDADALIRVYGESMGAGYQSGSFVPIKMVKNKALIVPGFEYVIETTEYRVLKVVRKSKLENHILACSLNDDIIEKGELAGQLLHEPFDINMNDVISISKALGNVRRNQITTINGKY